ncbi:MAG: pyridoxal phosphate-dependent aminotransferase [Bacteroidales bacterium]|nr:pyridoxal phosphate-dependent aminotransferase [Bacteroidales bacterium]
MKVVISGEIVQKAMEEVGVSSMARASIREIKKIVDIIEQQSGVRFVRMEMGIPGLPPVQIGVEAEIDALKKGVASIYPDVTGIPSLKEEIARFVKNFLDVDVSPDGCLPTVGSMQGGFASFLTLQRINKNKDTFLFIDPGFPVHKQQLRILGGKFIQFDVYNYRGEKLRDKLDELLSVGNVYGLLYSNPNNPAWICFTEKELQIIAELARKYDVVVVEDLAYIGMDFRKDYSHPGKPPFQPTIAKYYDQYILLISSSKAFSYAGQRIGMMVISDSLFRRRFEDLIPYYGTDRFSSAMIFGTIYALSSGTAHSSQYALLAILKAINDGLYNYRDDVIVYSKKAQLMKEAFLSNGFKLVYDQDDGEPLADGFYFTVSYPGLESDQLLYELLHYGISAISLSLTGSESKEGIRACVSLVGFDQMEDLNKRLSLFHQNHPI